MFKGELKPYQVDAVAEMVQRKKMLVAYEMGLGKTCMTIAALEELKPDGRTLIVALSSLKYQWKKEIQKFSDSTATVVDGNKATRIEQYDADTKYIDRKSTRLNSSHVKRSRMPSSA